MFGIGTTELLVILAVALIVIGPKKLPEIARTLGKAMGEFRRVTTDVQRTINTEISREDIEKKAKEEEKRLAATAKKADDKSLAGDVPAEETKQAEQAEKAYSSAMAANNADTNFRESEPAMKDITPEPVVVADATDTPSQAPAADTASTADTGKEQTK